MSVSGPIVSGDMTTLQLTFSYLRTSQAGTYSCLSIIDTPPSVQRDVRDIIVQSELDISNSKAVAVHGYYSQALHKHTKYYRPHSVYICIMQ